MMFFAELFRKMCLPCGSAIFFYLRAISRFILPLIMDLFKNMFFSASSYSTSEHINEKRPCSHAILIFTFAYFLIVFVIKNINYQQDVHNSTIFRRKWCVGEEKTSDTSRTFHFCSFLASAQKMRAPMGFMSALKVP